MIKVTGYSPAQTKHLIRQYVQTGEVTAKLARNNGFKRAYTDRNSSAREDGCASRSAQRRYLKKAMGACLPTVCAGTVSTPSTHLCFPTYKTFDNLKPISANPAP